MGVYGSSGRFDATAARAAMDAYRLGLNEMDDVLGSVYGEIHEVATLGGAEARVLASVVKREQLTRLIELLRGDGYIVDVDAGNLIIKWGRVV